jgi:hypothetical protein
MQVRRPINFTSPSLANSSRKSSSKMLAEVMHQHQQLQIQLHDTSKPLSPRAASSVKFAPNAQAQDESSAQRV